jgi:tripartite-type tricarboxylate transporter receptor subunit TctC
MNFRFRALSRAISLFAMVACAGHAAAQSKEGKIVVGNQPGGATDIVARVLAPAFSAAMGHSYIVENRSGASGNIAAQLVANAPADGNTILLVFNSHTTVGPLFPKLPFDPIKDFASVALVSDTPYLIAARPDVGVENLKELFERSKRTNKAITMGSPGQGTPQHLMMEKIRKEDGVPIDVAQYKGTAPAINDVMGGHVDITMATPSASASHVKTGKLKLLAVTSNARLPEFPNAPTATELGLKSLAGSGVWVGLLVPAKTPRATIEHLNKVVNDAIRSPEISAKLASIGMAPIGGKPEVLDKLMRDEQRMWTAVIKESKITLD